MWQTCDHAEESTYQSNRRRKSNSGATAFGDTCHVNDAEILQAHSYSTALGSGTLVNDLLLA